MAQTEEARLVAVSATFDDVADEWRAAVAADDRPTLRRVIGRLVRQIEVTPVERDGRRTSEVAIIFAFEPGTSVRPLLAYASSTDWITHVGIYIGNGQQLNAPTAGQVVSVQPVFSGFWGAHYAGVRTGRANIPAA